MIFTDNHDPYTVKIDYKHNTAEIIYDDTSQVFMTGEDADEFIHEYICVKPVMMDYFLSNYTPDAD